MAAVAGRSHASMFGTPAWYWRPWESSERWVSGTAGTLVLPSVSPGSRSAGSPADMRFRPRHDRGEAVGSPVEVWFASTTLFRSRP